MKQFLLEVCVDSLNSALEAEKGGADRIELCSNLIIGGTTPGYELYKTVRERISLPIHVLIRPRFGDFLYDSAEKEIILKEVDTFCEMGADAIVCGILDSKGNLDMDSMRSLLNKTHGRAGFTLHRAFDMCQDPYRTVENALELGIDTILTSGQQNDCICGKELLSKLITRYANEPVSIMAGGGIHSSSQVIQLYLAGIRHFHLSGKKKYDSAMEYRNPDVSMGLPVASEYDLWQTDSTIIREIQNLHF